jgi:hypothetical protein
MEREERIAENEILFRDINERIKDLQADEWAADDIDFMCECGDQSCTMVIRLKPAEYEHLRSGGTQFAVLPGHEVMDVEDIVETRPHYLVVEKHRSTEQRVRETDPRA